MDDINVTSPELVHIINELIGERNQAHNKNSLSAAESANLWTQYIGDSEAICLYTHFLQVVEDKQIRSILEQSIQMSHSHLRKIEEFFKQADYPIPKGYSVEKDVNLKVPRLFSDDLCLYFSEILTVHGFTAYSLAVSTSGREHIRNYFSDCLTSAMELYNKIVKLCQSKGLFAEYPVLPPPKQVEYVQKTGILADLFGDPKPLTVNEINNLIFNMKKSILSRTSTLAFSQIAKSNEVRQLFRQYADRVENNLQSLGSILHQDNLPTPRSWDSHITDSTISPFSDRLMMFHVGFKMTSAIAYYGTGIGASMRADVIAAYSKNIGVVMDSAKEWLSIMVKNGWLEKPPEAIDRKKLTQKHKNKTH